jgi:hypothetical protein
MIRARRQLLPALGLGLATAALAAPGAALAANSPAAPPPAADPAAAPVLCDFSLDGPVADGFVFSNQVGAAGCLRVLVTTVGGAPQVSVDSIATTPGWTATVANRSGKSVKVLFNNAATGARAEAKVEPGKTTIR